MYRALDRPKEQVDMNVKGNWDLVVAELASARDRDPGPTPDEDDVPPHRVQ